MFLGCRLVEIQLLYKPISISFDFISLFLFLGLCWAGDLDTQNEADGNWRLHLDSEGLDSEDHFRMLG